MVEVVNVDRKMLYEAMIVAEKNAYDCQDFLLDEIKGFFSKRIDEESADHTKIILAQGGHIQIRTILELDEDLLKDFEKEFNFTRMWFKKESLTDYRNVETVIVHIFEYAFIPKNINEILGDNQVDLEESL